MDLEDEIKDIIAAEAVVARELLTDDRLMLDLDIDSLDVIGVLFVLEERYQVIIDSAAVADLKTVGELVEHLKAVVPA